MPGFELLGKEEQQAVANVFTRGNGILMRLGFDATRNNSFQVDAFEKGFAKALGVKYAHAVTSGTAALKVALKALDIKPGDEVITQSFTFVATVEAIIDVGAIPIITEVNETLNMDLDDLEAKITKKTKAIIPVHMLGVPCQMAEIMRIARNHHIRVLEDACEAPGATYKGKSLGTIGDIGVFSFDFGKTITTGEGGMVVTNSKHLHDRAREYADHGHQNNPKLTRAKDSRRMAGFNFRMSELQGAVGVAQLKKLSFILKSQREHKQFIKKHIKHISSISFRSIPDKKGESADTLIFFMKTKRKADIFLAEWKYRGYGNKNIPDAISWHFAGTWSHMLPQLPQYKGKDLRKMWPKSADLLSRAIAIPIMVKSTRKELQDMVHVITTLC